MKVSCEGLVLEGNSEEITKVLKKLGYSPDDGTFYLSESKGLLKISDMHSLHIRNAIQKSYMKWLEELKPKSDLEYIAQLGEGPTTKTFLALIKELAVRNGFEWKGLE